MRLKPDWTDFLEAPPSVQLTFLMIQRNKLVWDFPPLLIYFYKTLIINLFLPCFTQETHIVSLTCCPVLRTCPSSNWECAQSLGNSPSWPAASWTQFRWEKERNASSQILKSPCLTHYCFVFFLFPGSLRLLSHSVSLLGLIAPIYPL